MCGVDLEPARGLGIIGFGQTPLLRPFAFLGGFVCIWNVRMFSVRFFLFLVVCFLFQCLFCLCVFSQNFSLCFIAVVAF